jgi:hypothetical protein
MPLKGLFQLQFKYIFKLMLPPKLNFPPLKGSFTNKAQTSQQNSYNEKVTIYSTCCLIEQHVLDTNAGKQLS